ncbi:hypothetical protein E1281_12630 [Actinomadura sp. KC345]|uniref:hypothetical protein n=1 Tax=Actinomadura sp. KC345 TaxID=2530371 RepID=UPI00104E1A27|nr:hypothetical protein [Actinomadura sp. KC345]TDC55401.1 hypothetical protein E1281_12630 [Actinomadura sp. KC345]
MGGALGRRWWTASGPLAGGLWAVVAGVGVISLGTGAFGLETHDFTRIDCRSVSVKGGTVWHCTGESPAQARANDEARRRAMLAALSGRRDGAVTPGRQRQRTRLTFVDHDGRRDPERVTASRLPGTDRWIAHSGDVLGAGVLLSLFGAAGLAWGTYRLGSPGPG